MIAIFGTLILDTHLHLKLHIAAVSAKLSAMTDVSPACEETDVSDEQHIREACDELREFFNQRLVESLLKATRHSLDMLRRRFFSG
jgi:hypothetical protein